MPTQFEEHVSRLVKRIDELMDEILKIQTGVNDAQAEDLGCILDTLADARIVAVSLTVREQRRNAPRSSS